VRAAFEDYISVLGENAKRAMMYELTVHGRVHFDEPTLSIVKLYEGLDKLYGRDTAELIIEEVILRLDRFAEERRESK
jgi:hypothetical protein